MDAARESSALFWNFPIIVKIISWKNHLKCGISSLICLHYCPACGLFIKFQNGLWCFTQIFLSVGINLQLCFILYFDLCNLINCEIRESFIVYFIFSAPQASEWYERSLFHFLGRSIFLSLTVNDVMASSMDLWATLRVRSIQKGNSDRQYVMDQPFGMESY